MTNQKLNCVLLIDDDEPTNFLHEMVIRQTGCANKVVAVDSGQKALDYLTSIENGKHPQPDLIFLDINMPRMNGWEFLDHYNKLEESVKGSIITVMLTTSFDPDDKLNAAHTKGINGFRNKPLTKEILNEIIEEHFSDISV